jgi:hypothetical protein
MKTIKLFGLFVIASLCGCNRFPPLDPYYGIFLRLVSPVYVVDQFDFPQPQLIDFGEEGIYILPAPVLDTIKSKENILNYEGTFRYFDQSDRVLGDYITWGWCAFPGHTFNPYKIDMKNPYSVIEASHFKLEDVTKRVDTFHGFPVYEFTLKPEKFALLLASDPAGFSDGVNYDELEPLKPGEVRLIGDVVDLWTYSKNYNLMVFPLFSKKEVKKFHKKNYPFLYE